MWNIWHASWNKDAPLLLFCLETVKFVHLTFQKTLFLILEVIKMNEKCNLYCILYGTSRAVIIANGCDNRDFFVFDFEVIFWIDLLYIKPLSVATNVVGLQTDAVDHVGQNSSSYVACVVGLQTDAVVITEARLKIRNAFNIIEEIL